MDVLPLRRLLDPRPQTFARERPFADSVNLPVEELPQRLHELPPPGELVALIEAPPFSDAVRLFLERGGRTVEIASDPKSALEKEPPGRLWKPNPFLEACVDSWPPGRAIDLGCGVGREAVWLAARGWEVVAIDRLESALERGRSLASRALGETGAARVRWQLGELSTLERFEGAFDLALMLFAYQEEPLAALAKALAPEGALVIETFTETHRARYGRPADPARLLPEEGLPAALARWRTRDDACGWLRERHTRRLLLSPALE